MVIDLACIIVLVGYFLHFALQSSSPPYFRPDDLWNIAYYWVHGPLEMTRENLFFWRGVGRPLGALYYLPLYSLFDLDPKPYRIVTIALVGATIPVGYVLCRSLTSSRPLAFLAVLVWCYHPLLAWNFVFTNAFIYDVLCSLFYLAALAWYVSIRERDQSLRPLQLAGCFIVYVCALNSKEMAVTLPVIILVYELVKYYHQPERQKLFR